MKLIMEQWRRFLNEDTRAFHGYKMDPSKMRVPGCDGGEPSPADPDSQWTAKEEGCPKFSDDRDISSDHPDIIEALNFIEEVKPETLIAYSRGGSVASAVLDRSDYKPRVLFVAPAWKRGWVSGNPLPPEGLEGSIVHGTKDNAVPLRQSFELAASTGMPLYVAPDANHINILKIKDQHDRGIRVPPEVIQKGLKELPEWEAGLGTPEQVQAQHEFIDRLRPS